MKKNLPLTTPLFICFLSLFLLINSKGYAQISWTQVPTPDTSATRNLLRGISGTSSTDIWTVGDFQEVNTTPPYYVEKDLVMHWDGTGWQTYPPIILSSNLDQLFDVEAVATDNVWAVGNYNDPTVHAKLVHYDGNEWSNYPLPTITGGSYLYTIDALGASDIWAAGGKFGSPVRPAYVIHYNGSSWTEINVPNVGTYMDNFNWIDALTANDVWAAGSSGEHYGDFHALVMHWNGSAWTNVPVPASISNQQSEVLGITAVAANDVWAVGYYLTGGMFKIHWDGSSWTEIIPPNGGGGAFAALASNDIYSFGGEISHWNGTNWTVVDSLQQLSYPSLINTVKFSNGEIWGCGRTIDSANNFYSLVYRSVNSEPLFLRGTVQNVNATGGVALGIDSLLTVSDNDVAQVLTYSIVTPPAHGTISGLPATAITANGEAIPVNTWYTANAGYTGTDQFRVRVSVGDFSSETLINLAIGTVVPVNLLDFQLEKMQRSVLISWRTTGQFAAGDFVLEKSVDGINFYTITTVASQASVNDYQFTDQSPNTGMNYYRLKFIDLDGTFRIFPVKSTRFDSSKPFSIWPNPVANGLLNISLPATGDNTVEIYDQQGRKVFFQMIRINGLQQQLKLPALPGGTYHFVIRNGAERFAETILVN